MSKQKGTTAAELMAELEKDPSYLEQRSRREAELRRREGEYARAEVPLVRDLRAAGSQVSSVWDLVNTPGPYPALVPILLAHLDRPYPERIREGIARALAVPESRQGWDKLVNDYVSGTDMGTHGIKWALHLAIAAAADVSVLNTLISLARQRIDEHRTVSPMTPIKRDSMIRAPRLLSMNLLMTRTLWMTSGA